MYRFHSQGILFDCLTSTFFPRCQHAVNMSSSTSSSGEHGNLKTTTPDYFVPPHNLTINPTISRDSRHSRGPFYPLYSPSTQPDRRTSTFSNSPTLLKGMSAIPTEHDYPGLPAGAEAPGARPTSNDLEYVRSRPLRRSSSVKSIQQIQREGTLSNRRSYLGLIPEAPIIEGYACSLTLISQNTHHSPTTSYR